MRRRRKSFRKSVRRFTGRRRQKRSHKKYNSYRMSRGGIRL